MNATIFARASNPASLLNVSWRFVALGVLLGMATAAFGAALWARHNENVVRDLLLNVEKQVQRNVQTQMSSYGHGLRGVRGAIFAAGGSEQLTREKFRRYSLSREADRTREFPGTRGFGFIRRVPPESVATFLEAARADDAPNFSIRQLSPNDGERWVIQYIEPQVPNEAAVGLDIASEAYRREAAASATLTGEATLTGPITLVQSSGQVLQSFLFLLPVYADVTPPSSHAERARTVVGWTYTPLNMTEALAGMGLEDQNLHLIIHDVTDAAKPIKFYESTSPPGAMNEPKLLTQPFRIAVASREWELELSAHPAFVDSLRQVSPRVVFGSIFLLSQLLVTLAHAIRVGRSRQRMIHAEQARLATIVENSSDAIVGESLDGSIMTWNHAAEKLFGHLASDVLGRPLKRLLIPPDRHAQHEAMLAAVARNDIVHPFDANRLHRDGHMLEVLVTVAPIRDEAGHIIGVAKQMHDIGVRKRAERQLKDFNAKLELMVSERTAELGRVARLLRSVLDASTEVALIATDPKGTIVEFNRGAERLLGYKADEMIGKLTPATFHLAEEVQARGKALSAEVGHTIQGFDVFVYRPTHEGFEERRWTYVRKNGSHVPVSLVLTAIRDDEDQITGFFGIAQDITARLEAADALEAAKSQAEAANAAKSMFLANMSHEIRTPMNAVVGIAHLLANSPLNEEQRLLLAKLDTASRSLMGIINDVLDIAKIEAGEMSLETETFSPVEVVEDLCDMVRVQAQAKGLALNLTGTQTLPAMVLGDALRLRQVLLNLLSNAVKFTQQGHIDVLTAVEPDDNSDRLWMRCAVLDTGPGIEPDAQQRLFTPFTQADASTTRRYGGTGLGLSLVKQLCTMMGGEVGMHSTVGEGSEFWFRVPLQLAPVGAEDRDNDSSSLEVFVVDDQAADRMVLLRMCRSLGWRAKGLESGMAMVERLNQRLKEGQPLPDALLVDWQMPGLDGLQALASLHQAAGQHQPASLIISAHEKDTIAALDQQGLVDTILTKPVGSSELFNAVNLSVAKHSGSTDRVARSTRFNSDDTVWLQGARILVVDDSQLNLDVCRQLLEREGANVETAEDGLDALTKIQNDPERFDAVLMDVQMPEMDGYEATRRLRQLPTLKALPVIALTAGALTEERHRAREAGMDDFLTKPIDPPRMVAALRRVIEARRGTPLPVSHRNGHARPASPTWPTIPGVDMAGVANRLGEDVDLFRLMLSRLLSEFEAELTLEALRRAERLNAANLSARMHKLRGSAGMLGATELQQKAATLEHALRHPKPGQRVDELLSAVSSAFDDLAQQTAPFLAQHSERPANAAGGSAAVDPQALARFITMLQEQDLAALEHYAAALPAIQAQLGEGAQQQVWEALQTLDFARVLALLQVDNTSNDASAS